VRPVPIPNEIAEIMPGERLIVSPPGGDLTGPIPAVEAMLVPGPPRLFSMRLELEDSDLEKLAGGQHVWLTMLGSVVPFQATVGP
jgi:hypothetical protein